MRLSKQIDRAMSEATAAIRNATVENPSVSLDDPEAWGDMFGGLSSGAGVKVSHRSALTLAAVWQAVSIISGDVAIATPNVFKRLDNEDREIDRGHPAQYLVSTEWNEVTSAFEGWRRLMAHALLWTNGYAYVKRRNRRGIPLEMYNLLPDRTAPYWEDGDLYYATEVGGKMVTLFRQEVLHVKGLSIENGVGYDLVAKAREAIGLALAAEGFSSKFFANGAQAGGILEVPANMSPTAKSNLESGWAKKYTGQDNWFKTVILRDGAKFHQVTVDAQKSQMHQLREDQVRDIARFYNLPPSKLGLSDSVSYNSAEQSQISYVTGCLSHWLAAIRGESQIKLLTEPERKGRTHFIDHNTSKLIEPDAKTLNEVLGIQRANGVISPNEWRRKINMPQRTDPGGDEYGNPYTTSGNAGEGGPTGVSQQVLSACRGVVADAIQRAARRSGSHARSLAKNGGTGLCEWIDAGAEDHRRLFMKTVKPSLDVAAATQGIDDNGADCLCERFFSRLVGELEPLTQPPHKASELSSNTVRAMQDFENTIAAELLPLIFKETPHEE